MADNRRASGPHRFHAVLGEQVNIQDLVDMSDEDYAEAVSQAAKGGLLMEIRLTRAARGEAS